MLTSSIIYASISCRVNQRGQASVKFQLVRRSFFMAVLYVTIIQCVGDCGKILQPYRYCLSPFPSLYLLQEKHRLV
jgi:hypothetical protein